MADTFRNCTGLTSITIPESVTSIGSSAFSGCTKLTVLNYNAKSAKVSTSSSKLSFPSILTKVNIGNGVESIPSDFVYGCSSLTSITIPESVTSIGYSAFSGCTGLREIHSNNATPPSVYSETFSNVRTAQCKLYVPIGSKDAYAFADGWADFVNIIEEEVKNTDGTPCATPTITLVNGKVVFACDTKDAKYHYSIKATTNDSQDVTYTPQVDLNPVTTYVIECYASADGYADSETATKTITISPSDVNLDGAVNISDVNAVITTMCGK